MLFYSLLAGLATLGGGFVALLVPRSRRALCLTAGIAGGIMLFLSLGELIPSAMDTAGLAPTVTGCGVGLLFLWLGDQALAAFDQVSRRPMLRAGLVIAAGIAFHDFPEGMAITVGYELEAGLGLMLVVSLGLHNLPEGLAVASPLLAAGVRPWKVLGGLFLISLCTPIGAWLGLFLTDLFCQRLGMLLAAAAGAMLYVTLGELLPQAWRNGRRATLCGLVIGGGLVLLVSGL